MGKLLHIAILVILNRVKVIKAISYIMSSAVAEPSENGKLEPEKVEEKFLNMIKSIDFAE